MIKHLYRKVKDDFEYCFNIEASEPLTDKECKILFWLLAETFEPDNLDQASFLGLKNNVVEVGPRMNFATAWNTNALSILRACGITKVTRIERSRRYNNASEAVYDRMTEMVYEKPLTTFETGIVPEAVYEIPLIENGPDELLEKKYGLKMDEWDRKLYHTYFVGKQKRNPTIAEIKDLYNANSEHSRHGFFRGKIIIDGEVMTETLMDIVKSTLEANPVNSVLAFCDNSSVIKGYTVETIIPQYPGRTSAFKKEKFVYHILFTAETHNFPSGVAPFPGAETGTGGRIRDVEATGRGGLVIAGTVGYCVGNLYIPEYKLPWENPEETHPDELAKPLEIEIQASNGASDYGNKFGEPVIQGFTRSFDMRTPNGERRAWLKPIMFTGGVGQIDSCHLKKEEAKKGMLIVQIGGPAYRIGMGGGAASSLIQGENIKGLDFDAVQRGDAEMEQKMNRVIRACIEMGDKNPIVSIHDQGAGGPANVQKELVEKSGGKINIRKIKSGDPTLSILEIWVAEYQERNGLLIEPGRIEEFKLICEREKVNCEILGEVTGDGIFTVYDEQDDSIPVHLHLADVLGNMPQKTFTDARMPPVLKSLEFPKNLTVREALERVLRNVAVSSKRFLTNKVDRSVTGLIAQQQCCGPLQLTVSNVAVILQSHFGLTGAAISIGEQPIKMLVNPEAGARMAVGEALTNMVWAKVSALEDIKCSANWMWAAKRPGEAAKIYAAACAARDLMKKIGIAIDGGKDSLSMAAKVGDETVKAPGQLVISAYCTMPDITKVVTPNIKSPGNSQLIYINLAKGKRRLGGSALAQCYGQIGDECPDVEDPDLLESAFKAIQKLIDKGLILSGHDVSDGGLIITLLEMAFAGNCGLDVKFQGSVNDLFAEEVGLIIEGGFENIEYFNILSLYEVPYVLLGRTISTPSIKIRNEKNEVLLNADMRELRQIWEETSYQLERLQCNPMCAEEEKKNIYDRKGPQYKLTFMPEPTPEEWMNATDKPKVAIIRIEGSNGDREMTAAFFMAGFECHDVAMTDLLEDKVTLDQFRGIAFVGGFSYADVLDSAKGWAGVIKFGKVVAGKIANGIRRLLGKTEDTGESEGELAGILTSPSLLEQFDRFYHRPDTFSFGVCNGCQLMALLGWVPFEKATDTVQPRFIHNFSGRFESRWSAVKILPSPAIMLKGMEGSILGVWIAHGEGRFYAPYAESIELIRRDTLAPICFVDDEAQITEKYPFNPNGSPHGITALCSPDGRHLAMMPHPERAFLKWQWGWMPEEFKELKASPWLKMFQNARIWCEETKQQ